MFQRLSDSNQCVELMKSYLCHYYFPSCNQTTLEILPVCRSSCVLVLNNGDCSDLRVVVNNELANITSPGETCLKTHRSFGNPPPVSGDCAAIES